MAELQHLDWGLILTGTLTVLSVIFAVTVFVIRSKDTQAWKPVIDGIPLMQKDITEIGKDVAELKGIASVIPAVQAAQTHQTADILELKQRVRDLEQRRQGS